MLRWILGDDAFFAGIKNYFNDPNIANGFASNDQLVSHMEIAGDTSLTEFFNDWYYGEGYPVYSIQYDEINEGKYSIKLSQTSSHTSVNFFEMPVPVRIYNELKTDSLDIRLYHTKNNQEYLVETGFEIGEIKIDPDYWLVSKTSEIRFFPFTQQSEDFRIYPNPFSNEIRINTPFGTPILKTELFNTSGTKLTEFIGNSKKLNLSSLPAGIYFIRISIPGKKEMKKLIKL
jgi:hypothetical protein